MTRTTGRAAFVQLLVDEGITHLFGNPGTTELAIMEAVPEFPQLKFILGLQESVVMAMADGYCRASGRLAAAHVHVMPGLGKAMGALYKAQFSGSPVIPPPRGAPPPRRAERGPGLSGADAVRAAGAGRPAAGEMGGRGDARGRPA